MSLSSTVYRYDPKKRLIYKTLSYRNLNYLIPDEVQLLILNNTIQESMDPKQHRIFQQSLAQVTKKKALCLVAHDQAGKIATVITYKILREIPPWVSELKKERRHRNLIICQQLVMIPAKLNDKEQQDYEEQIIKTNVDYLLESYAPCAVWIGVPENDRYIAILTDDGFIPVIMHKDAVFLYKEKLQ